MILSISIVITKGFSTCPYDEHVRFQVNILRNLKTNLDFNIRAVVYNSFLK